jgi:excisionase family DNA binding protein
MEKIADYMTLKQVANELSVSVSTVSMYTKRGDLDAVKLDNGAVLISRSDFEEKKNNLVCRRRSRDFDNPKQLNLQLEAPVAEKLTQMAKERKISVSGLMREMIVKCMEEAKKNG